MFDIPAELKKLPDRPGVYIMHDSEDHIIYVGKAIVLKNRVRQYFQAGYKRSPKIEKMVSQIAWFEYIVTDSETEALVLECNLIKEHNPKYNTMLTDDKTYPFIRISVSEAYPRVTLARKITRDGSKYFGPYTSGTSIGDTIKLVQKLFTLRSCHRRLPEDEGKERPCLNYHIGLCKAPCQGFVSPEEYGRQIAEAEDFLKGNFEPVKKKITQRMLAYSDQLDFENAAMCRELLKNINHMEEAQKITDTGLDNRDIIALAREAERAVAQVFFVREGKLLGRDHVRLRVAENDTDAEMLSQFIKQFYASSSFLPGEIMLEYEPEEAELISSWLSAKAGHKVSFYVPQRGEKLRLLQLACDNAKILLSQSYEEEKRREARTVGAVKALGELIGLEELHRIEAYDISNISGFQSVGSMVVFQDGEPRKNDYRKFKIKTVTGPNDYASLYEVITRRLSHGNLPDVILMDGGRGQVNVALQAMNDVGIFVPVCGMVKDDNHRTRGLFYNNVELPIDKHGGVFQLITRIQDEAHRFAITYHRALRGKDQVHSVLDDIEGVGPARRKALMRKYGSLDAIKAASVEELAAIPEMNMPTARVVYAFFHEGELPD